MAEVNEGMFPERRSADELEHNDVWEEALAAMGETIAQETPVFQDVVGGPSTIDDPDGLEGPTGFIPFRVPAAHPEVVDTETYVDYLLRDELSQNSAEVVRNSVHAHLRVIEGGTNPLRLRTPGDTGTGAAARHRHAWHRKVNTGRFTLRSTAAPRGRALHDDAAKAAGYHSSGLCVRRACPSRGLRCARMLRH